MGSTENGRMLAPYRFFFFFFFGGTSFALLIHEFFFLVTVKKKTMRGSDLIEHLEEQYQQLLGQYSYVYSRTADWYVGERLTPYLFNYMHYPTLFFQDGTIDVLVEEWAGEFCEAAR